MARSAECRAGAFLEGEVEAEVGAICWYFAGVGRRAEAAAQDTGVDQASANTQLLAVDEGRAVESVRREREGESRWLSRLAAVLLMSKAILGIRRNLRTSDTLNLPSPEVPKEADSARRSRPSAQAASTPLRVRRRTSI